ncbi:PqqD family protein [Desulforhopalus singaporensis]|uniref:Coenzyme PQQ synthesis protein D (PqqD) n=1 Tax=Desulforhopalus singaporensis TaxID=91360 RepID=A0A1H0T7Y7_9BACT|nr:PqqD family protein [Desulforhopalus singaporensis]SDP50124.1 Coenzyme PQQ synthesis protein D (PqqD) [Desulforhopalus singaporensis]
MELTSKPTIQEGYKAETFDGEVILYTVAGTKAVYLNGTAQLIWLLCQQDLNVGEIQEALIEQYPQQAEQIRSDVIATLEDLQEKGVITLLDQ